MEFTDYQANFGKDEYYEGRAISNPEGYRRCEGCVFQRYVMTPRGQCWKCRHPNSDGQKIHEGDPFYEVCEFGIKE